MRHHQTNTVHLIQIVATVALLSTFAGCGGPAVTTKPVDPQVLASYQQKLALAEEPNGAQGIQDVRTLLTGHNAGEHEHGEHAEHDSDGEHSDNGEHEEHSKHGDNDGEHSEHAEQSEHAEHSGDANGHAIIVVGMTPAADAETWHKGHAEFTMLDPSFVEEATEHEHADGGECKFCASDKANAQAIVQFVGEDGKTLAIDARELFGLKGEEIVVVRGNAKVTPIGMVITADGLHVRQ